MSFNGKSNVRYTIMDEEILEWQNMQASAHDVVQDILDEHDKIVTPSVSQSDMTIDIRDEVQNETIVDLAGSPYHLFPDSSRRSQCIRTTNKPCDDMRVIHNMYKEVLRNIRDVKYKQDLLLKHVRAQMRLCLLFSFGMFSLMFVNFVLYILYIHE